MFISKNKIQSIQQFLNSLGRFLLILAFGSWLGAILFLGIGVAPVNFQTAEEWQLEGIHPQQEQQVESYRSIGGALTAGSIKKLNSLEVACTIIAAVGFALFWVQRRNRTLWLFIETAIFVVILVLFAIYAFKIGDQLHTIREQALLNFSDSGQAAKSQIQQTFDTLHKQYTRLTGINVVLILAELVLIAFKPALRPFGRFTMSDEE